MGTRNSYHYIRIITTPGTSVVVIFFKVLSLHPAHWASPQGSNKVILETRDLDSFRFETFFAVFVRLASVLL